jgi:hypothetical protein
MSLRNRRMDAEWKLLEKLAEANQRVLARIARCDWGFFVELRDSPAWMGADGRQWMEREHALRYVFPRYYPALPLEGYLERPVLHPNVDPANGFVCLWKRYRTQQTIVDAVAMTRAVLSWSAVNPDTQHCMQTVRRFEPLEKPELVIPAACWAATNSSGERRRLSNSYTDSTL